MKDSLWNGIGRIKFIKTKTDRFLEKVQLKKSPSPQLPAQLTKTQKKILQASIDRGEVVGGSFAQKTLYPSARAFQDLDIISTNPKETTAYLRKKIRIPTRVKQGRHGYTITHAASGKTIADVVPSKFYNKYIEKYGSIPTRDVNGVKILNEDVLFREKVRTVQYGNPKLREKTLKDVRFLSETENNGKGGL